MTTWRRLARVAAHACAATIWMWFDASFVSILAVHDVHERLIALERAALQLDVLANEVVVHVHTPRWISDLHGLGSVISSSTRVYRLSSSPHVPSSRCTGRSSLQQKHGHGLVHACRIYSWTKTNYRRCARYVYLHSAPFRLLMMQHNS